VTSSLLKSADVARLLQVHPKQIYRLLARGLPAHRVGSEWRFSRDQVLAWSGVPLETQTAERRAPSAPSEAPPLLAANGDLVVEILIARLTAGDGPLVGFVQLDRGRALERLAKRTVLLAGFHGAVPPSHVEATRLARVHLVAREIGLAHPRGSRLRRLKDIAKKRVALRPPSAGVRAHFDAALAKERATLASLGCKTSLFDSHREAVFAVLRGEADVALTTSAWAERVGLGFFRLATEPYDLLVHADSLGTPVCVAVCEVAQSAAFKKALGKVKGYDPSNAGEILYDR
jgi:putative molybdopterin biosynthesis protein